MPVGVFPFGFAPRPPCTIFHVVFNKEGEPTPSNFLRKELDDTKRDQYIPQERFRVYTIDPG
jgi:hypothetical protein